MADTANPDNGSGIDQWYGDTERTRDQRSEPSEIEAIRLDQMEAMEAEDSAAAIAAYLYSRRG